MPKLQIGTDYIIRTRDGFHERTYTLQGAVQTWRETAADLHPTIFAREGGTTRQLNSKELEAAGSILLKKQAGDRTHSARNTRVGTFG